MSRLLRIDQMLIRATGVILLALGIIIWTGRGQALMAAHVLTGFVFVLALLVMAALGAVRRIAPVLVVRLALWAIVIAWFGLKQTTMLPGNVHWVVRVLHPLVGLIGIGLAEAVAAKAAGGQKGSGQQSAVSS
jgi:hypothetical protein